MGNKIWGSLIEGNERLFKERVSLDLSENIHLHYRDLRIVFSQKEWENFADFIAQASLWKNTFTYEEGVPGTFQEMERQIPPASDYFNGKIGFEEQTNGDFHLHYHDFRFEFKKEIRENLLQVLSEYQTYYIKELFAIVYEEKKEIWVTISIQESPIYKGLFDGFVSHDIYMGRLFELIPDDPNLVSTEQYKALRKDILENGFDFAKEPRVFIQNNIIREGHHRISILMEHFGPYRKLIFHKGYLLGMVEEV